MRLSTPPLCLACVAVLFPHPAAGQRVFAVQSEVTVRADSFACKERAELDRLLQRNQSGGFTLGQLYDYLKAHKCVGLTDDPKDNKINIYPCAWTRGSAVEITMT